MALISIKPRYGLDKNGNWSRCRAKNPNNCPYHTQHENITKQEAEYRNEETAAHAYTIGNNNMGMSSSSVFNMQPHERKFKSDKASVAMQAAKYGLCGLLIGAALTAGLNYTTSGQSQSATVTHQDSSYSTQMYRVGKLWHTKRGYKTEIRKQDGSIITVLTSKKIEKGAYGTAVQVKTGIYGSSSIKIDGDSNPRFIKSENNVDKGNHRNAISDALGIAGAATMAGTVSELLKEHKIHKNNNHEHAS